MTDDKMMQNLAIRLFLSVGFAVSLILFGIMFFFVGVFFLGSTSVSTEKYRNSSKWWIMTGLLLVFIGFPLLIRILQDTPEPGSLGYKHF